MAILLKWNCLILMLLFCSSVKSEPMESVLDSIAQLVNWKNTTWKADRRIDKYKLLAPIWALTGTRANDPYRFFMSMKRNRILQRTAIPSEFDSRKQWSYCPTLHEIFEQGKCASCWAVAPADVMSDRICIHSRGRQIVRLSAGNILSCCRFCGKGCNGGFPAAAWFHWQRRGVVTGGSYTSNYGCQRYPFRPCNRQGPFWRTCPQGGATPKCVRRCQRSSPHSYEEDLHFGERVYKLPQDVEEIQMEILTNGPVQAALRIYEDFLTYRTGVYQHLHGRAMEYHAVKIIGWGEENGVPYWLGANMWSTHWGNRGFFKILRGFNHAEIESHIMAGIPRLKPSDIDNEI